jgi:DNA-binding MarR family transcriptional regulator
MSDPAAARELNTCTLSRLRKVTRRITQIYDAALEPSGLTITQFGLLTHLQAHGSLSIGELADGMVMDATTLTRLLRPLERDKLVAIASNLEDRRRRDIELTPAGRAAVRKAVPLWRSAQLELHGILGAQDHQALQRVLGISLEHLLKA